VRNMRGSGRGGWHRLSRLLRFPQQQRTNLIWVEAYDKSFRRDRYMEGVVLQQLHGHGVRK
jgi:hypothetical protein